MWDALGGLVQYLSDSAVPRRCQATGGGRHGTEPRFEFLWVSQRGSRLVSEPCKGLAPKDLWQGL